MPSVAPRRKLISPLFALIAQYIVRMATNLDVDLSALDDLMRLGGFRSKREAVDAAVREAIAYRRQLKSIDVLGAIEFVPEPAPRTAEG